MNDEQLGGDGVTMSDAELQRGPTAIASLTDAGAITQMQAQSHRCRRNHTDAGAITQMQAQSHRCRRNHDENDAQRA
jgi:hypothetical protein